MNTKNIIKQAENELNEDFSSIDEINLEVKNDVVIPKIKVSIENSKEKELREIREEIQEKLIKYSSKTGSIEGERISIEESKITACQKFIDEINKELSKRYET